MAKQTKGSGPAAERWYETNETYAGSVVDATKAIKIEEDDEEKGGEEVSTFFPPTDSLPLRLPGFLCLRRRNCSCQQ